MDAASTCRELARRARFGALATTARDGLVRDRSAVDGLVRDRSAVDPAGWPYVTLVAVGFDARGRPLMLLSRLAEHTKNLEASGRASLLVSEHGEADPLAAGRMTLVGTCARVPDAERDAALATFLDAHPEASGYAGFGDFAVWRLEVAQARWIGGFGRMEWIDADAYAGA